MCIGSPIKTRITLQSAMIRARASKSSRIRVRLSVGSPCAVMPSSSLTAKPIRRFPRSRASMRPLPKFMELLRDCLGVRRLFQMRVETEILRGEELGGENNLSGMLGKMLDYVINGLQARHLIVLNASDLFKPLRRELANLLRGRLNGPAQPLLQLPAAVSAARREFAIALANVGQSRHAGPDPLPHVAAKVQHQVADGVFIIAVPRPDLTVGELIQTRPDAAGKLQQLVRGKVQEDLFRRHP